MHAHAPSALLTPRTHSLGSRACADPKATVVCASGADFYDSDDEVLAEQEHGLRGAKVSKSGTASIIHSYAEARQPVRGGPSRGRACVCVRMACA